MIEDLIEVRSGVKVNAYRVIAEAVERGIMWGWKHAHKHVDDPGEDAIKECIERDVMIELCEVLRFED